MRKLISFMHISLDGFVAGPNGESEIPFYWPMTFREVWEGRMKMKTRAKSA